MTSFYDDRDNPNAVKPFPYSAERAVVLGEAFEGLEHALLVFDAQGKLISANARAREILDLPGNGVRKEADGSEEDSADRHYALDRLAKATGLATGGRFVWPSARGVLDGTRNVLPSGGSVVSLIARQPNDTTPEKAQNAPEPSSFSPELITLAQDLVTARDEARAAVRRAAESQSRVEAIVESVVDAIITTDGSGTIHTFNRAAEEIFGYNTDEIIGKTLGSLFLPHGLDADADLFSGDVAAKIQSVLGRSLDEVGLTKAGIIFPVRFTATEMELDKQQMLNWVIRDVTEDRRTREALQHKSNLIKLLHSVAEAASDAESIAETVEVGMRSVCGHIGWPVGHAYGCGADTPVGSLWFVTDEKRKAEFEDMTLQGSTGQSSVGPASVPLTDGMLDHVATNGDAVWFTEADQAMSGQNAKAARACGIRSGFAIPILMDGEVVVVLEFFTTESVEPESTTLQALTQVGSQLSRALERKRADETIRRMALRDPLTGLANREQFQQQMPAALASTLRTGRSVALLFLDVDNFKDVNDTLGHPIGDQLLKQVAKRLTDCCRETDTVARLGGDEFAVIATNLDEMDGASMLANRIVQAVSAPVFLDGREVNVTGSVGVTLYPADGLDAADLQKNADLALYRAKDEGKNAFRFYDAEMNRSIMRRKSLEQDLRAAIGNGAFELHYQPQMDLDSGAIVGAEALLRWPHPDKGLIAPMEFIPLAEATGLIVPLGAWVLRAACSQFVAWQAQGLEFDRLAVNLSSVQLNKSPIIDTVTRVLKETGLAPERLELELTESTVMDNVEAVIPVLQKIHDMGITVAVDDFGTGYSSLSYLKRLPVDKLKIDRSFVSDVTNNEDDAAIARAITNLATTLRLQVVAEGVETEEQLQFLKQIGCHGAQGYHLSKPLPADDFAAWLARR